MQLIESQRMGGPDKPKREFGINENLAREILELHTLGVNGGYTQGAEPRERLRNG
jgi:uncharacterized protein (DUF1800 family)